MARKENLSKPLEKQMQTVLQAIIEFGIAGLKAAEAWVAFLDSHPEAKERFIEYAHNKGQDIKPHLLNQLERVGRHQIHPAILVNVKTKAITRIQHLPYSDQADIFDHAKKYPLLLPGGAEHLLVDARQLSKEQADQLIGDGYIRDLAEQKAYLVENPPISEAEMEVKDPYRIAKDALILPPHTKTLKIGKSKLREILLQM